MLIGYHKGMCGTIVPLGIFCHTGHHSWVGLTIASFPSQLTVFSGTMKAGLEEGGFQVISSTNHLSPVS